MIRQEDDSRNEIINKSWLVNNKAQCIVVPSDWWHEQLNRGLKEKDMFTIIKLYEVNKSAPENSYLVHRPSGGLGDIICMLPGIQKMLEYLQDKNATITLAFPKNYHWLLKPLQEITPFNLVAYKTFHKIGFNISRHDYRYQYFIWCPAGKHEDVTDYRPTHNRIDNFSQLLCAGWHYSYEHANIELNDIAG